MSVHIGLMIWKEMKRKNISVAELSASLQISKIKVQEMLNTPTIDIPTLVNVSEILEYNFFHYYENSETFSKIQSVEKKNLVSENQRLKALLLEKNRAAELLEKLIKSQASTISLLERQQFR